MNITAENENLQFLAEGGQMGELIRALDWSTTALGSPATWPQSLRFAVRIMLDCPFGIYIAWGEEYIQLYNDGYRPILGATKHPQALGIGARQTFAEIWTTIGPMFEGVMQGIPVGFPDFICKPTTNPIPTYPIPSSVGFQNCGSSSPSSDILQSWIRLSTSFSQISGSI